MLDKQNAMRFKTFSFLLLLLAIVALPMSSQSLVKKSSFYASSSTYFGFGENSPKRSTSIDFTYRFRPISTWGVTLSLGDSEQAYGKGGAFFASLLATTLPIENTRFQIVPALGFGVAHSKLGTDSSTFLFYDVSVSAQYFVTNSMYSGVELRYMANKKVDFTAHLLGMKIGFTF